MFLAAWGATPVVSPGEWERSLDFDFVAHRGALARGKQLHFVGSNCPGRPILPSIVSLRLDVVMLCCGMLTTCYGTRLDVETLR